MKIYLIGYMGSGKSTVGKKLAQLLHYEYIDLDILFEKKYKLPVISFFGKYDENAFRILESSLLKETATFQNTVIATGGGTPCFFENMSFIKENGKSVYIQMHPKSLAKRIIESKKKRPLAQTTDFEILTNEITERLIQREPFYLQADFIIKGEGISAEDVKEIIFK